MDLNVGELRSRAVINLGVSVVGSAAVRDEKALREFAQRDWAASARSKELYWRDWKRQHGPAAGIRVADELRRQVLAARPDWPSESERQEDLATHLRMIEVIRRARPRTR